MERRNSPSELLSRNDGKEWKGLLSGSNELPTELLSDYKMQWALDRPLRLLSSRQTIYVSAYKLATQSLTFRRLIKEIDRLQKRQRTKQVQLGHQDENFKEAPLLIDCHRSTDVNDLAFAIHFCHLGQCRITAITAIEQTDAPPTKRRDEKFTESGESQATGGIILSSTGQLHLTTKIAECSLTCGLRVANTYGIDSLHRLCMNYMKANLNTTTCWTFWQILFIPSNIPTALNIFQIDEKASHVLIDFMHENFSKFVPDALLKGITHFSASELELMLASNRLNAYSESSVVDAIEAWVGAQAQNPNAINTLPKLTARLIEHCVRPDQLEIKEIDRLLKLPGMQAKGDLWTTRTGNCATRDSSVSIPNSPRNCESRNRCVWLLQQCRRRLVRATRNLRSLSTRLRVQGEERIVNWFKSDFRIPHEAIIVFGGWENGKPCRNVRVLDSRRKMWKTYDAESESSLLLPHPLMSFGIANVGNQAIYIAGGESKSGQVTQEVLRYDFKCSANNRGWKRCAPMHEVRRDFVLVNFKDKILYAIGGDNNRTVLDSAEALCVDKSKPNSWIEVARMLVPRGAPAGDTVGSEIYICGGYTESRMESLTNSCEAYNPDTNQWTLIQPMAQPRYYAAAVGYQNHLYILGGGGDNWARMTTSVISIGYSSTVERYTPEEGVWELMPAISERADFAACVHENKIFCIGGGGEAFSTADIESWRPWVGKIPRNEERVQREGSDNSEDISGPIYTNAPIWMPLNEGNDETGRNLPESAVRSLEIWHKEAQLPLPLWGHRCVSVSGVDKVIQILGREPNQNSIMTVPDDLPKRITLQRWKIKKTASNTILTILDAHESMFENVENEDEGENERFEIRVGNTTVMIEY